MVRDRGTMQFALMVPVFQLVLFGLIDTNVSHVPTAVFDQSRTQESRQLVTEFVSTGLFDVVEYVSSHEQLRERIVAARASAGVEIPPDYARKRLRELPADVLVLIDFDTHEQAGAFTADPSLKDAMANAGVTSAPELTIREETEGLRY